MAEKSKDAERAELTFHSIFDTRASVCRGSRAYVPFMIACVCGRAHACVCACARMYVCVCVCVCVCVAKAEIC